MALQYWVGDFFVDISRNQITQQEQSQIIAPKALAVLTYLAQHQGKVVSYEELLANVWPDTVVTTNTLQRSIAQLRKVLGENSKSQSFIKTHAKQGYSLECLVRWNEITTSENKANNIQEIATIQQNTSHPSKALVTSQQTIPSQKIAPQKVKPQKSLFVLITFFVVIVAFIFIALSVFSSKNNQPLSFDKLQSLTASDDKEYAAVYSPDGQYIVFHRYSERLCRNNLWAKNIATQQETLLTRNTGTYGIHSFSRDGKKLLFVSAENCNAESTETNNSSLINKIDTKNQCNNLVTLDFEKAMKAPQTTKLLVECKNSQLKKPVWIDNNNIVMMQKKISDWHLIHYSINENKSKTIFEVKNGHLIAYDYSAEENVIAVTSAQNDGLHYLHLLTPNGTLLSTNEINFPKDFPKLRHIRPIFDVANQQLVFTSIKYLYALSYEGEVSRTHLPIDFFMENPNFHPSDHRLLLIKKTYDSDIALFPLALATENTSSKKPLTHHVIERSTNVEQSALFQPNGEHIAFISQRSGEFQLWASENDNVKLISSFPSNTLISGIDWAADGKSILVNANGALTQVYLNGQHKDFSYEKPITTLFQWNSEKNTALLKVRIQGKSQFGEADFNTNTFTLLSDKKVTWAQRSEDGQLIYTDYLNRFWQQGPLEDEPIDALINQGSSKRFVVKNNKIYGVNTRNELWEHTLKTPTFKILEQFHDEVEYLTDINQTHALIELYISGKKEVVELSSSN